MNDKPYHHLLEEYEHACRQLTALEQHNKQLEQERDQLKVEVEALKPYRDNHHDLMRHMAEHDAEVIEKAARYILPSDCMVSQELFSYAHAIRQKAQENNDA